MLRILRTEKISHFVKRHNFIGKQNFETSFFSGEAPEIGDTFVNAWRIIFGDLSVQDTHRFASKPCLGFPFYY